MSNKRSKNSSVLDDSDSVSELSFHSFSDSENQSSDESDYEFESEVKCKYILRNRSIQQPIDYRKKLRKRIDQKAKQLSKKGLKLSNIPKIFDALKNCTHQELSLICKICSICPSQKKQDILKELSNFNGFEDESMDQKIDFIAILPREKVKYLCDLFGVDRHGSRREQAERIVEFLQSPENYFFPIY